MNIKDKLIKSIRELLDLHYYPVGGIALFDTMVDDHFGQAVGNLG